MRLGIVRMEVGCVEPHLFPTLPSLDRISQFFLPKGIREEVCASFWYTVHLTACPQKLCAHSVCKLRGVFLQRQETCILASSSRIEASAEALAVGDSAHIYDSWRERDMQIVVPQRAHTNRDHLNRGPLSYNGTRMSPWTLSPYSKDLGTRA